MEYDGRLLTLLRQNQPRSTHVLGSKHATWFVVIHAIMEIPMSGGREIAQWDSESLQSFLRMKGRHQSKHSSANRWTFNDKQKQKHQQINIPNSYHIFQQHSGKFHNMSNKHIEPNRDSSASRESPSDGYPSKHM